MASKITTQRKDNHMSKNVPVTTPRILVLEGLMSDTAAIVERAGADATEVYPWDIDEIHEEMLTGNYHGLVLTGGSDIDPRIYNEKPDPSVYGVDYLRDACELLALELAMDQGIPVLGICRGSQIMCAYRGGKLTQDIDHHQGGNHQVAATPEARTFKRAIGGRDMSVISLHHQCVRRPGKGMRIAARGIDNTPEAIESKDGLWLGVQFHPEITAYTNANSWSIFKWLVDAAAKCAGVEHNAVHFKAVKRQPYIWKPASSKTRTVKPSRAAGTRRFFNEESGMLTNELFTCDECNMLFDDIKDRDDHFRFFHLGEAYSYPSSEDIVDELRAGEEAFERSLAIRYPELEPPKGHEAWAGSEDILTTDELYDAELDMDDGISVLSQRERELRAWRRDYREGRIH